MADSFYTMDELREIGFKSLGDSDIFISRKASIYGTGNITVGNHVRIDDFCLLSGKITIGEYVHIAAYAALFGGSCGIVLKDFSGISSRSAVYAQTDDYSGDYLTNPAVPEQYRNVREGTVTLEKHVLVGSGCTILPDITIGEGTAVGSMSLVNQSLDSWGIYAGIPCRRIKERSRKLLEAEKLLRSEDKMAGIFCHLGKNCRAL
jgi:Acetyltransferase (isoleucine patch superfamily)